MAKIWIFSGLLVIGGKSLLMGIAPFLARLIDKAVPISYQQKQYWIFQIQYSIFSTKSQYVLRIEPSQTDILPALQALGS